MRRLFLFLALSSLALAACGQVPPEGGHNELALAANKVAQQLTFKASTHMTMETDDGTFIANGVAEMDQIKKIGAGTMAFSGDGPQAQTLEGSTSKFAYDFRDGFVVYMDMPMFRQAIPDAKEWIRVDFQKLGEEMGFDFGSLMQSGSNSPSKDLDYLKGTKDVETVGTEEVSGVSTTHYKAILDFDLLAEASSPEASQSIAKLKELTGLKEAPMEVWLDEQGLPRRMTYVFDYDPPDDALPGTPTGTMTMAIDYYDYGKKVDVSLPPEDKVTDFSDLMPQGT